MNLEFGELFARLETARREQDQAVRHAISALDAALVARCKTIEAEIAYSLLGGRAKYPNVKRRKRQLAALSTRKQRETPRKAVDQTLRVGMLAELGIDLW